jgi:hypothetical protein
MCTAPVHPLWCTVVPASAERALSAQSTLPPNCCAQGYATLIACGFRTQTTCAAHETVIRCGDFGVRIAASATGDGAITGVWRNCVPA